MRTHIGGDAALALVAVASGLGVRGPAHVQVVEHGVRSHLVSGHHQLERVGLAAAEGGGGEQWSLNRGERPIGRVRQMMVLSERLVCFR